MKVQPLVAQEPIETTNIDWEESNERIKRVVPRQIELEPTIYKQEKYVYTAEELLNRNIQQVPMMLEPLLPKVGIVALAGSSDTGKSTFLRQLAIAVSRGDRDFLGLPLNLQYGKALYVSSEDDSHAISALLQRQKSAGCQHKEYRNLRFIFDTSKLCTKLEEQLQTEPVDCIIVDAFADLFEGEMNVSNKVRSFLQTYADLARRHECLVIFLHHTGKRTENMAPSKDNLLGSQGFEGKMRAVFEFRRDPNESNIRHLCVVKGNYIAQEHKNTSFALNFDEETMLFRNTGNRVEFKDLVKRDFADHGEEERAMARTLELHNQNLSLRQIEAKLADEGISWKKSKIHNVVKNHVGSFQVAQNDSFVDDEQSDGTPCSAKSSHQRNERE